MKCHRLGDLNRHLYSHRSEDFGLRFKVLTGLAFPELPPCLIDAAGVSCPYVTVRLCLSLSWSSLLKRAPVLLD